MKKLNEIIGTQLPPVSGSGERRKTPPIRITGTVRFIDETDAEKEDKTAEKLVTALAPDNLYGTETEIGSGYADVRMTSEKIGSLLATADDLLMNADGAVRVKKASESGGEDSSKCRKKTEN